MQLSEIKARGWWAIEDDPITPNEITDAEMGTLVNQAVANLADVLNINASAIITLTGNLGALPTDLLQVVRIDDANGNPISQIDDINDKDKYSQFWFLNSIDAMVIQTTSASASVTMYYKAYPAVMTVAAESPMDIPSEFHHYIADIWVKAHYALKKNFLDEYNGLMLLWDDIRQQIARACNNRRSAAMIH